MVISTACAECRRRDPFLCDGGCRVGCPNSFNPHPQPDYSDAELDLLIGRGYHAEEVKDAPGEAPTTK